MTLTKQTIDPNLILNSLLKHIWKTDDIRFPINSVILDANLLWENVIYKSTMEELEK